VTGSGLQRTYLLLAYRPKSRRRAQIARRLISIDCVVSVAGRQAELRRRLAASKLRNASSISPDPMYAARGGHGARIHSLSGILRCYGQRRSRSTSLPRFTSRRAHSATQFGPGPSAIRVGGCKINPCSLLTGWQVAAGLSWQIASYSLAELVG
jgi:hypothetical protein